jgi:nodulation protein E
MSADLKDLTAPDPSGMARAINAALSDATLAPDVIDYVNAHGTGTVANDEAETAALHMSFGGHARQLAVSSTKSMVGHALGAAGALELVAVVMALCDSIIPPTISYLGLDPACDLDYVPNEARHLSVGAALSNSFAFGGLNAAYPEGRNAEPEWLRSGSAGVSAGAETQLVVSANGRGHRAFEMIRGR